MRTNELYRASLIALGSLFIMSGCVMRPAHHIQTHQPQAVVVQQQPVVVQQRPVVVQQRPVVVQQRPIVIQQPPPVVVRNPSPVLTPVRVSVPARPAGSISNGHISYPHQRVRYPLNLGYSRMIRIYVDGHGLDPTAAVYDSYGRRVAYNDDGGSGLDSQLSLSLAAGHYVIEIAGYSSSTGSYTLTVN